MQERRQRELLSTQWKSTEFHSYLSMSVGSVLSGRNGLSVLMMSLRFFFLASSSEFDQMLQEDRKTNRIIESCDIFETIVNYPLFMNIAFILFLNKTDLLEEKVKHVSIKDYFPSFNKDPHSLLHVQEFILNMFDSKRRNRNSLLYHHFTTAIDTENIRFVFESVKSKILQDNLRSLMLQ